MNYRGRVLRFHLITRCLLLLAAAVTVMLKLFAPDSLAATVSAQLGEMEGFVLVALTLVTLGGLLDIVVNDFLPKKFHINFIQDHRHVGYAVEGGLFLIKAFGCFGAGVFGGWVLVFYYMAVAFFCGWYTWAASLRPTHAL